MAASRWRVLAFLLAVVAWPGATHAHDADVVYVEAVGSAQTGELDEVVTLTGSTLGLLAPVDADGDRELSQADLVASEAALRAGIWEEMPLAAGGARCERSLERALLMPGYVRLEAHFRCGPGELRQDFRFLRVLPANYRVVLGSQVEGEQGRASATGRATSLLVPRPPPPGAFNGARFDSGLRQGLARSFSLEVLAAWAVLLSLGGPWRRSVGRAAVGLLAAVAGTAMPGAGVTSLALVCAGIVAGAALLVAVKGERAAWLVALAVGLAAGLRGGGGPWSEVLGLAAGTVGALGGLAVVGIPLGRVLARRPVVAARVRLVLACAAWCGFGFQLLGALKS